MISKVLSFCVVLALSKAGVIHSTGYPGLSPLNAFYPELPPNIVPRRVSPLAAYQSAPFTYPAHNHLYSNILPQQLYQYAATNYPYVAAPLQYSGALEEITFNEGAPIVYVEPVVNTPHQHDVIPEAIVETQPEYEEKPHYLFAYSVVDSRTGDNKQHQESRDGDVVRGEYSLLESDGTVRRVEYTADPHKGFNAIVSRSKPKEQLEIEPLKAAKAVAQPHH